MKSARVAVEGSRGPDIVEGFVMGFGCGYCCIQSVSICGNGCVDVLVCVLFVECRGGDASLHTCRLRLIVGLRAATPIQCQINACYYVHVKQ